MVLYTIFESHTIKYIKHNYPEKFNELTFFLGQRIKHRKLKVIIKNGEISDYKLSVYLKRSKILMFYIWLMLGAFLALLAA